MFNKIFLEKDLKENPYALKILSRFKAPITEINSYDEVWGKTKRPYLQKRQDPRLFIARKKGQLVKLAPDAYGLGKEKHYYFIHAYNCIYECEYCYLQGHFSTPDIVLFVNHEEIIAEMQKIADTEREVWFHAGEFSDSLALSHVTGELDLYWEFFKQNPHAKLELRTKSVNIKTLKNLPALRNAITSFSLASSEAGKQFDLKCPSIDARIKAAGELAELSHPIGIHLDPIIYSATFEEDYKQMIDNLFQAVPVESIQYISIGVVRFTKSVYREVENNYKDSELLKQDFIKSFDGKVRYNRPMRMWMMNKIKQYCLDHGVENKKIYLCMEQD